MLVSRAQDLLKEGSKHLSGIDEAVKSNIDACKDLAKIVRTSLGPNGMNKMIINSHDKLFVTSDAATIIKELDVVHPAAKMVVMASQRQEEEIGDATNLVVVLAGDLLAQAETLLRMGLHTADVISGFEKAWKKADELLDKMVIHEVKDIKNVVEVARVLKPVIAAKHYGFEDYLAPLVAQACVQILPKNPKNFNVDYVRVAKLLGGGVTDSYVLSGMIIQKDAEGTVKQVTNAKVAVFSVGIDVPKTEGKGTLLIKTDKELMEYQRGEDAYMERLIKGIAEAGAKVVVSGGTVGDIAMHFLEKYKLMVVKSQSKVELKRLCKALGATALVRLGIPTPEELGHCDYVGVQEIGSTKVTVFRQDKECPVSTVVVRAATQNVLDDIERAIDDAVNIYKVMTRDAQFVAGAGACELELARQLKSYAASVMGQDQYAINKFAESLETVPRTLAENAGLDATEIVSQLYGYHSRNEPDNIAYGIDIESGKIRSAKEMGVYDSLAAKRHALRLASNAAITILRIDQIIMAKPSEGPKPPKQQSGSLDTGDD